VQRVIAGKYRPKGFTQADHDEAMLVRIMGGPRLLFAMQKVHGLESASLYDKKDKRRFVSSWGSRVQRTTVVENLDNFALRKPVHTSPVVHHLMIDDLNIEKRRRVSPHDNIIRGYAREGDFSNLSLTLNSYQVLQKLHEAETATPPRIELADEVSS
jgi:hypothetical protein